jgi:hypothetical protein
MKGAVGNIVGKGRWLGFALDNCIQRGVVPIARGHFGVREGGAYGILNGAQGSLSVAVLGRRVRGSCKAGYSFLFVKVLKGLAREVFCVVAYDALDW